MAEKFDPYYTWLGIPPQEQPPHFYRLLGLEAFEENREVISTAANRQLEYLRELGEGEQRKYAKKLLEFISKARDCLLDPQRKATYDDRLRTKQAQQNIGNLAPLSDKDPGSSDSSSTKPSTKQSSESTGGGKSGDSGSSASSSKSSDGGSSSASKKSD